MELGCDQMVYEVGVVGMVCDALVVEGACCVVGAVGLYYVMVVVSYYVMAVVVSCCVAVEAYYGLMVVSQCVVVVEAYYVMVVVMSYCWVMAYSLVEAYYMVAVMPCVMVVVACYVVVEVAVVVMTCSVVAACCVEVQVICWDAFVAYCLVEGVAACQQQIHVLSKMEKAGRLALHHQKIPMDSQGQKNSLQGREGGLDDLRHREDLLNHGDGNTPWDWRTVEVPQTECLTAEAKQLC